MAAIDVKEDAALVQMTLGMEAQGKAGALSQLWRAAKTAEQQMAGSGIRIEMDAELAVVQVKGDTAALQEFLLLMKGQIAVAMQPYLWISTESVTLLQQEMEQDAAELRQFQRVDGEGREHTSTLQSEKQQDGAVTPTVKSAGSSQLTGEAIELDMPESRVIGSPIEMAQIGALSAGQAFGFILEQQEEKPEQEIVTAKAAGASLQKQVTILTDVSAQQNIVAIEALLRVQVEPVAPVMPVAELSTEPEIMPVEPEPLPETEASLEPSVTVPSGNGGTGGGNSSNTSPPSNTNPVATDDTGFSTIQNTPLIITVATELLANDTDVDNDSLSIIALDAVSANGGTIVDNNNGTFTYTPAAGFIGADSFTYTVSDGHGGSDTGTINMQVTDPYTQLSLIWDIPSPATTSFSTMQLWLDSNDLSTVTLNGNQVTGLADKATSVAANNASAPALANAPVYGFSSSFGLKTLKLDGTNDYLRVLDADNLDNTNGLTIFTFASRSSFNTDDVILSKRLGSIGGTSYEHLIRNNDKFSIRPTDDEPIETSFLITTSENYLLTSTFNGTALATEKYAIHVNGEFIEYLNNGATAIPNLAQNVLIGRTGAGSTRDFHGDIHEVMIFNSALSDTDRQAIERYFAVKYGHTVDASVPSDDVPVIAGNSTDLDRLEVTGGALQISLKDDAPITAVEYLDLRGNNASHAIAVRDSYFDTLHEDTVILDATGNTEGVIFSGTLVTDASKVLDLRGSAVADVLAGGAGNDKLTGNGGTDSLTGEAGNDIFIYNAATDSGTGSGNRDIIKDFVSGDDQINIEDLASFTIVSTNNTAGNGIADFTGAGIAEIAWEQIATDTIVMLDTNGDGTTNLEIELTGLYALTATDFIL